MDADGTVPFGGGVFVSQCFGWFYLCHADDCLWCKGSLDGGDLLSAPESVSDPCLYPDDVCSVVLHAPLAGGGHKTDPETGTAAEADGVLHLVWSFGFAAFGGGRCGADDAVVVEKFHKNGGIDHFCDCFLREMKLF